MTLGQSKEVSHSVWKFNYLSLYRNNDRVFNNVSLQIAKSGTGPAYFKDVCCTVVDTSSRANLRSAHRGDMFSSSHESGHSSADESSVLLLQNVWNSLPLHSRSPSISRAGLKTRLFNQAYTSLSERFVF